MPVFVIEHLEPDVFEWCVLEYAHVSSIVGKENLIFTNTDNAKLQPYGKVEPKSVIELQLQNACVLDPDAPDMLTPENAKQFKYFVFGGILGDNPPKARTGPELTSKLNLPVFNLGKAQMSTDTAVIVTHEIINGTPLEKLKFQDGVEIETGENESVQLPYKYLIKGGKPLLAPGLAKMLKEQDDF